MLSAASQVILRNKDYFSQGRWLIANATDSEVFNQLNNPNLAGFHQYFDVFEQCQKQAGTFTHHFSHVVDTPEEKYDGAILYMPKAKEHARMLITNLAANVKSTGTIFLVGENKSGIKGADKLFANVADRVNKLDSARHCSLFCASLKTHCADFNIDDWYQSISFSAAGCDMTLVSLPGVFSANELDAGTKLLLDNLPKKLDGRILDFASGNGVIGCVIAHNYPETEVVMSDVSALAVHCSKKNALSLGVQTTVVASDGLNNISGQFAHIFSNPPFHTGIKTDYSITDGFIKQIAKHLRPSGRLTLVANRFLPYPDMLDQFVGKSRVLAQTSKFNLYSCG